MTQYIEDNYPPIRDSGLNTQENASIGGTLAVTGVATFTATPVFSSGITRLTESINASTETVGVADSGKMYVDVLGSGTTTFTLPGALAGLWYSFVAGSAAGEILINPASGDAIVGKTHGAENGAGIAPAAGTGIKNTAATNVVGDFCTLVALDTTTWYMVAVAGVWASQ